MVFTFLDGCILNGFISTYIIALISPLGPQSLKQLLSGPLRIGLLTPTSSSPEPPALLLRPYFPHIPLSPPPTIDF